MKRAIGFWGLVLALAAGWGPPTQAAPDDQVKGPACVDITANDVDLARVGGLPVLGGASSEVTARIDLPEGVLSCAEATYSFSVVADDYVCDETRSACAPAPGAAPATDVATGEGQPGFDMAVTVADDDSFVCVSAASTYRGRVADVGPNTGCLELAEPDGGIGMR